MDEPTDSADPAPGQTTDGGGRAPRSTIRTCLPARETPESAEQWAAQREPDWPDDNVIRGED